MKRLYAFLFLINFINKMVYSSIEGQGNKGGSKTRLALVGLSILLAVLIPNVLALSISTDTGTQTDNIGYYRAQASTSQGNALAWGYTEDGSLDGVISASADDSTADTNIDDSASTTGGHCESGTFATNTGAIDGVGAESVASIDGVGTIGMSYLGTTNANNQHASVKSTGASAQSFTGMDLESGSASIDSMATGASGNLARVVVSAVPASWMEASQIASLDQSSASASMDVVGISRVTPEDNKNTINNPHYVVAYSESGNGHGQTNVQYLTQLGILNTGGVTKDNNCEFTVPQTPSPNSITAYADSSSSNINSNGAGSIFLAGIYGSTKVHASSKNSGYTNWTYEFTLGEMEMTGTASQNDLSNSALIY